MRIDDLLWQSPLVGDGEPGCQVRETLPDLKGPGAPRHRPAALRLDPRGRLRQPLRRRCRSGLKARVMFAVQQPLPWSALEEVMGVPAWRALPSWFLVADGDQTIPPDAERQFAARMGATAVEVSTNHVAMVSHPDEVLQLIKTAAEAVPAAT
ncbi:MAG TPA: alpha/beta fold hydrolase [Actinomycetota bacterium]|nr:alpha/beta fold hydrolase [Actinomycetota bacterium]